ncbi:MAG: DoxX family membrane protein [Chloroflexi bacterium]|nr:DoxX family membrane protein [Chloroflexota bacterium]
MPKPVPPLPGGPRRARRPWIRPSAVRTGRWLPRLAVLALAALLAVGQGLVLAHEPWVLSKEEMEIIRREPLPELFATLNPINATVGLLLLALGWLWFTLDRRLGRVSLVQRATAWLWAFTPRVPLVLRLAVSVLLLWGASKGSLFVPELSLRQAGAPALVGAEVGVAALLILGLFPRIAALLLLALEAVGLWLFGWDIVPYAGIVAGPACYLLARGNGAPALPAQRSRGWSAALSARLWEQAPAILRVLVGLNLIYLGVAIKYFTPGLFTAIVVRYQFPTFGLAPEVVTMLAAAVEAGGGLALALGLLPRLTAMLLAASFVYMTAQLQEDLLGHTIFFGIALAITIEGKEKAKLPVAGAPPQDLPAHQQTPDRQQRDQEGAA